MPTVLQGDSFAYLPEKTGKLDSYAALFDPKWKGYVALEDNYTTAGQKTALYLKKNGLANIANPDDMTKEEFKTVIDFLIDQKKKGQFRVIWNSFEQAVNLIINKEVYVIDCWEPMVFVAKSKGIDAVYADPKEGYLLWAMAAYLVKNPNRTAEQTEAAYKLLDFMLGGWYGAKITNLRGYMTNPQARELCQGTRRPSSRPRRPRRSPRSPRTSGANSGRAAPGRTAGRPRSSSTNRSGRASRRRDPRSVAAGAGRANGGQALGAARPALPADDLRRGLPRHSPGADGDDQLLGAGRGKVPPCLVACLLCLAGRRGAPRCAAAQPRRRHRGDSAVAAHRLFIAYFLARKVAPATARIVLVLFTVPFLINYIVRDVS